MLQLFTDTDTDVTPALARKYGYQLISMPYSIDGETYFPYQGYEEFDFHTFYESLRGGVLPTTSAISEECYRNYFEPVFQRGDDILYVHFSAAMTVTFDNMKKALEELLPRYPERKFYEIDTKAISSLCHSVVTEVGEMVQAGAEVSEILKKANDLVEHTAMYFFADDLKFFKRSGRVSGLAAMMGTLIGIRPIIYMNPEGKMVSIGKEKGRVRAMEKLVSYVVELGDELREHPIIIGHTDAPELAEEIATMLREKLGSDLPIQIIPVNPTAGSHCGPNGVGITFHAVHR